MKMCVLCVLLLGAALAAQTKTDQKEKQKPEMITLSGCIVRGEHAPGQYTLDDKVAAYFPKLTGADDITPTTQTAANGAKALHRTPDRTTSARYAAPHPQRRY